MNSREPGVLAFSHNSYSYPLLYSYFTKCNGKSSSVSTRRLPLNLMGLTTSRVTSRVSPLGCTEAGSLNPIAMEESQQDSTTSKESKGTAPLGGAKGTAPLGGVKGTAPLEVKGRAPGARGCRSHHMSHHMSHHVKNHMSHHMSHHDREEARQRGCARHLCRA